MTLKETFAALKEKLCIIDDGEIEARYILENVTGIRYSEMPFRWDDIISEKMQWKAFSMADRRLQGEPVQYILGEWDFMDFTFKVGEGVLIPRPETEILVENILHEISSKKSPVIYDLCSGSGCIGLSLKLLHKDAEVYLVEKSDKALSYLRDNNKSLCGTLDGTTIIQGDILKVKDFEHLPAADVIVSNPPYIRSDEIPTLQSEVLREPVMALDGGDDGLMFYRVLVKEWSKKLKSDGYMAFECGEDQAMDICHLFDEINFDSNVFYDYNNIQRIVTGRRKV